MAPEMRGSASRTSHVLRRLFRDPVFLALVVTALVHVIRRNVVDIVVFFGMCGVILLEQATSARWRPRSLPAVPPVLVLAVCLVYGVLLWPLAQGGWPMRVLVALPGLAALALVLRAGAGAAPAEEDRDPPSGWWVWPLVLVVAAVFELGNFLSQGGSPDANPNHPTLTAVIEPLFTGATFRAVFAALWLAAGVWLVRAIVAADREVSA